VVRRSIVFLASCRDYDPDLVTAVVREGLERLDASQVAEDCIRSGHPVLLKPNMLRPSPVERGVTTHPSVFSAVAGYFKETGAPIAFGDSPNGVFRQEDTARQCGLLAAAEALGIPSVSFDAGENVMYPQGVQNRRFRIARAVLDAGALINLPKLKSHSLTRITAAMKNVFGVIPGALKAEYHVKHPDAEGFSRMIADLNGLVKSRLVVMDAVKAMEGNGPASGDIVDLGLILFSDDPVAADAVACRIIGVDPMSIPMIRLAEEAGTGNAAAAHIDLQGEDPARFRPRSFSLPSRSPTDRVPRFMMRLAKDLIVSRPVIDSDICTMCGECVQSCPTEPKSLSMEKKTVPRYDYGTCIRCYCCQETCPRGAISLARAPLARFFGERV
jgi:uncharacterized protein (DUF362 family)/Pyruvate/2-oxoacid:ferredoxin oxidoreductase delta subunit